MLFPHPGEYPPPKGVIYIDTTKCENSTYINNLFILVKMTHT